MLDITSDTKRTIIAFFTTPFIAAPITVFIKYTWYKSTWPPELVPFIHNPEEIQSYLIGSAMKDISYGIFMEILFLLSILILKGLFQHKRSPAFTLIFFPILFWFSYMIGSSLTNSSEDCLIRYDFWSMLPYNLKASLFFITDGIILGSIFTLISYAGTTDKAN